jgi:hypothetical protein
MPGLLSFVIKDRRISSLYSDKKYCFYHSLLVDLFFAAGIKKAGIKPAF